MKTKHKLAIHELLGQAAYLFDMRDAKGLENCFLEEAEMRVNIAGGTELGPFQGRGAIMDLMHGTWAAQTDVRRHIICDVFFESTGNADASAISTLLVTSVADGEMSFVTSGVYTDRVRKTDAGWQIAARTLDLDKSF